MEPTEDLVRRAQEGDDVAFTRLVREVYPRVYRWALVQTISPDDAEDVAQAALVRMHRHIREFRHGARFTTWLYAIVRRAAADCRRAQRRRQAREQRYSNERVLVQEPHGAAIDAERALAAVHDVLRDVPLRQREVFDLVELQGVPQADVAELLNMRPSTVRVHLLRARRTIRSRLLERSPHMMEELR